MIVLTPDRRVINQYKTYCKSKGIEFQLNDKVNPYDNTTLFCPSGMQQFKDVFKSKHRGTISNVQSCLRLKDLEEIGDGTHLLFFNMIGLFSFRLMTVQQTIDFWMEFLEDVLKVKVDHVTIHPDKINEWSKFYDQYDVDIKEDPDCTWTDGSINGYCTEFYKDDMEIGNIVNPLGDCIDVGFGLERLEFFTGNTIIKSKEDTLIETCEKLIYSGYYPSNKEQGYVFRKLLRELYQLGSNWDNDHYQREKIRQEKVTKRYKDIKNRPKYINQSKEWWFDTMGVDIDFMDKLGI